MRRVTAMVYSCIEIWFEIIILRETTSGQQYR